MIPMTQDEKDRRYFLKAMKELERKLGPAYVSVYETGRPKNQPIEIPGYERVGGRVYYVDVRKKAA